MCGVDAPGREGRIGGARVHVCPAVCPARPLPPWAGRWVVAVSRIWLLSQDEQSRVLPCDSDSAGLLTPRLCLSLPSPSNPSLHKLLKIPPRLPRHPLRGVKTQLEHGLGVLLAVFRLCHPASEIAAPLLELPGLLPPVKTAAGIFPKILQA